MKFINHKFIFSMIFILGTIISIRSNSWFIIWVGLEVNIICFTTFILKYNNIFSSESILIYFIFQAFASLFFLFGILLNIINIYKYSFNLDLLIICSLIIKVGRAPFHYWIPLVIENLDWINNYILITWQKIIPLVLRFYFITNILFNYFILISLIVRILGRLNQNSLRLIIAYSSINQIRWLLITLFISKIILLIYILLYIIILYNLIIIFKFLQIWYLRHFFFNLFQNIVYLKFIFIINILSIRGLPPFLGFFPKLLIVINILINNQLFLLILILSCSLLILFVYLRIFYRRFLFDFFKKKKVIFKFYLNYQFKLIIFFNYLRNFLLILILIIYYNNLI